MVKVETTVKPNIPVDFELDKKFYQAAARFVWFDQSERIQRQKRADGGRIKDNPTSIQDLKKSRGQPNIPLVDGWRTRAKTFKSTTYRNTTRGRVRLSRTKTRARGTRGHMTAQHHFVGKKAFRIRASKRQATVELPPDSKVIAEKLRLKGYVGWWGIAKPTAKKIMDFAVVSMRRKIKTAGKRAGKRG